MNSLSRMYRLWTPAFLSDPVENTGCYTTEEEWARIHAQYPEAKRIFGRYTVGEKEGVCALGAPLRDLYDFTRDVQPIVIPLWLYSYLSVEEGTHLYKVEWITEEAFPPATKIVLRPHDSAFYYADAKEELESTLTRYGVLQLGSTIPVPIGKLEGFTVMFDIVGLEPANVVLMEGEEVEIEFEEALDSIPSMPEAVPRPPTPIPEEPFLDAMLPEPPKITRKSLGGVTHAPLPDGRPWNPWRSL